MIQPDLLLAQLILEYLQSPGSIAAGVPAEDVLPKDVMDSGKPPVYPSLIIAAKEQGSRGARRTIVLCPMVLTWLKSSDPAAANVASQTTRLQASEWLNAVDQRLRDYDKLGAFLSALPEARRAGWQLLALPRNGGDFPPLYDKDTAQVVYGLTQTYYICVGP